MPFEQGYYNLPQFIGKNYAETDLITCFRVFIPDVEGDEYKQQLLALINIAATRAAWWTDTDEQRAARADVWQKAYLETLSKMDCGCEDCAWLIECLENEEFLAALDAAIAGLLNNPASATSQAVTNITQQAVGNALGNPLTSQSKQQALNQGADTCDKDALYGACVHAITTLNRLNQDFLEEIEALTDNQEMLSAFVSAIPILETLPIDDAIAFAGKIREFVQEFYLAGYDVDLESEMICALFCLAVANDCVLNMDVITDYFWNKASLFPPFDGTNVFTAALDILEACANWEEMTGEAVVFCMMAANVGFLSFLNSALGMDFGHFKLQTQAGIPSDDWMIFCEECADVWTHEFDFTLSDGGWTAGLATYSAGVGWVQTGSGGAPYTVDIYIEPTWGGATLENITLLFSSSTASAGAFRGVYYPGTGFAAQTFPATDTGDYEQDIVANNPNPPRIEVQNSNISTDTGFNVIRGIILSGTGNDPF